MSNRMFSGFGAYLFLSLALAQSSSAQLSTGIIVKFRQVDSSNFLGNPTSSQQSALAATGLRVAAKSGGVTLLKVDQIQPPIQTANQSIDPCIALAEVAEYCEPNFVVGIDRTPNDPAYSSLWALDAQNQISIDASQAWDLTTGSDNSVVAVLDTGIDYNHPDLAANVWTNPAEIPDNGIDDDGDGYVDDVHGVNTIADSGDPFDDNMHGTHLAGTIGAVGDNSVGVVGVNWRVKILAVKFMDGNGAGTTFDAIKGLDYLVDLKTNHGINILAINNSWGGTFYSKALEDAIIRANNAGILIVAAAGNSAMNLDNSSYYPASYLVPNMISVASIDQYGNISTFSNYGHASVDIAAPGSMILSTVPGGGYLRLSGTSMAAPHVTGAIALLNSWAPGIGAPALRAKLLGGAKALASLTQLTKTGGMLNLFNMLTGQVGGGSGSGGVDAPTPEEQHVKLSSLHKILTSTRRSSYTVAGAIGQIVRTRFVLNGRICSLKSVKLGTKRKKVSFVVPPSALSGDIALEAVNIDGILEDSVALILRPGTSTLGRTHPRTSAIKLARASAKLRDAWCRDVHKTIRLVSN